MYCRESSEELLQIIIRQVNNFFCKETQIPLTAVQQALKRTEHAFSKAVNKYYHNESGEPLFNRMHSVQYAAFLWFLSNTLSVEMDLKESATDVYYLNKVLHSVDWYHEIALPAIWWAEHPVGTVLGRAQYSDYFVFYQNCTVGGVSKQDISIYPSLGHHVHMGAGASVLGDSRIGNYVIIGAETYIVGEAIPDYCVVCGRTPDLCIMQKSQDEMRERFKEYFIE